MQGTAANIGRPRAKHKKVKTGCLTCKIRKVKCDETKPSCKRCTDTGRKCDGYASAAPAKQSNQFDLVRYRTRPPSSGCPRADTVLSPVLPAGECRWVLHFSTRTGPALSNFGDSEFWSRAIPQRSITELPIRHALLAVASSHAQFERDAASETTSPLGRETGLIHYNRAIASLQLYFQHDPTNIEIPLICCLLFVCLESIFGDHARALNHLRNGLRLLDSEPAMSLTSTPNIESKLRKIFQRLDAQSTLFGNPVLSKMDSASLVMDTIPKSFNDIYEAQRSYDTLISISMRFIQSVLDGSYAKLCQAEPAQVFQGRLQERLLAWTSAMDMLDAKHPASPNFELRARLLRMQHTACFVHVSHCLQTRETAYDAFQFAFASIVRLARLILQPSSALSTSRSSMSSSQRSSELNTLPQPTNRSSSLFALGGVCIPPLFLTANKCRDPHIRREAIHLLEKHAGEEGMWDARLHAQISRRVVEVEENLPSGSLSTHIRPDDLLAGVPDESHRIHHHEIVRTSESRSAKVVFFTRPEGILGPPTTWDEQLSF